MWVICELQEHFHIINHEHANIPQLSDLTAVEQFDLPCSLVEIVSQWDAVLPLLDLSRFSPQFDVHGVTSFEHLSQSRYMNCSHN